MTYEEWWKEFTELNEEWRYADRDALQKAAFNAGIASRDAEVVSLTNQRDYEHVRAENAEQERDQLREQVTTLRALCMEGANGFGRLLISTGDNVAVRDWQKRCKDVLAATEPKT